MSTVLCLGNILMGDDGIGVVLGHLLQRRYPWKSVFICETDIGYSREITDLHDDLIVIDAVDLGANPGESITFPLKSIKYCRMFQHDFSYNFKDKEGVLYGVQIAKSDLGIGISNELMSRLRVYIKEVSKLI